MTIASLLLVLVTATIGRRNLRACPARLPRRVVRTLPPDAPGRGAAVAEGLSDQIDRCRPLPDLTEKYGVDAVPTFIVVDPQGNELDRTSGSQPAAQLARFYLDAKAKAQPPANSRAHAGGDADDDADGMPTKPIRP